MSKVIYKSPKRSQYKVKYRFGGNSLQTSATAVQLHDCTDAETLIRTEVDIRASAGSTYAAGTDADYEFMITVNPRGQTVSQEVAVTSGAIEVSEQELYRTDGNLYSLNQAGTEDFAVPSNHHRESLKGMRKLKPGDTISLRHIASSADKVKLNGIVTLFFKSS